MIICFRRGLAILWLLALFLTPVSSSAQDVPPSVQQELDRRGMSADEAIQTARRLGIDLNDPVAAAARARQLRVPEATIQAWLRAVSADQGAEGLNADSLGGRSPFESRFESLFPDSTRNYFRVDSTAIDSLRYARFLNSRRWQAKQDSVENSDLLRRSRLPSTVEREALALGLKPFGYSFFEGQPDQFDPESVGAVDDAYVVGPGDELRLVVWGAAEFSYTLEVDPEGRVFIPRVGQYLAAGKSLSSLRAGLRRFLSRSYAGLETESPTVFMDLTMARLRPVQIFVVGEVERPGAHSTSPLGNGFNAVYASGGPALTGSMRSLKIVRGGRTIGTLDLYGYLVSGYGEGEVSLRSNDLILVPPREITVAISGAVRRPGIFELVDGEGLKDLLGFAGGLGADAYGRRFQIERITPLRERQDPSLAREVLDLSLVDVLDSRDGIPLRDGDVVRVSSVAERLNNGVSVTGAVFQPGVYQLKESLRTLRDLIAASDGVREDAYLEVATLVRLNEGREPTIRNIDLRAALSDDPLENIVLRRSDSLHVRSRREVLPRDSVSVEGQVREPGKQLFRRGMTLSEALFEAGGLQDSVFLRGVFLDRADLYRRLGTGNGWGLVPIDLSQVLEGGEEGSLVLSPGDSVRVYPRDVSIIAADSLSVLGAVSDPGRFAYREGLTVEDLILQAGGLTQYAYLSSVRVIRPDPSGDRLAQYYEVPLEGIRRLADGTIPDSLATQFFRSRSFSLRPGDQVSVVTDPDYRPIEAVTVGGEVRFPGSYALIDKDETLSSVISRAGGVLDTGYLGGSTLVRSEDSVAVDFSRALSESRFDMRLLPGDQISIPRSPNTVLVEGNVNRQGLIRFQPGRRVSYYLDRAGGRGERTEAVYLRQADGTTFRLRGGLFPSNPVVSEGARILVTEKPPRDPSQRTDVGGAITEALSIITAALTAVVIATRL